MYRTVAEEFSASNTTKGKLSKQLSICKWKTILGKSSTKQAKMISCAYPEVENKLMDTDSDI